MPVIRCERCDASQYVAATHATVLQCARCGHQIPLSRKALIDPVIAAGVAHHVRRPSALTGAVGRSVAAAGGRPAARSVGARGGRRRPR